MKIPKLCKNGDGRAFAIYPKSGGKREYFGEHGTDAANKKYKEWVVRLLNSDGLLIQEKNQSEYRVVELVSIYVDFIKPKVSKKQFSFLWKNLDRLTELCGSEPGISIGPRTLIQYQQMMAKEEYTIKGKKKRYKRVTINKAVREIKEFVKWCCKYEYLPAEHHLKLTAVGNLKIGEYSALESDPVLPVDLSVVLSTLPYLSPTIRVMVQVQYYCGLRPGEVCHLKWSEIRKDTGTAIWLYIPNQHKTRHKGCTLIKAIPPTAQKLLLSEDRFCAGEYVFDPRILGRGKKSTKPYFSVNGYGASVEKGVKLALEAGVIKERWTPNQIRHAIATDIRELYGVEESNDYLGHASVDATEIYANRTKKRIIELAQRLEADLFQKVGADEKAME